MLFGTAVPTVAGFCFTSWASPGAASPSAAEAAATARARFVFFITMISLGLATGGKSVETLSRALL